MKGSLGKLDPPATCALFQIVLSSNDDHEPQMQLHFILKSDSGRSLVKDIGRGSLNLQDILREGRDFLSRSIPLQSAQGTAGNLVVSVVALDLLRSAAAGSTVNTGTASFRLEIEIRQLSLAAAFAPNKVICTLDQIEERVGESIDLTRDVRPRQESGILQNVPDQELWRLNVRELPHLYLYRPAGGVWPDQVSSLRPVAQKLDLFGFSPIWRFYLTLV